MKRVALITAGILVFIACERQKNEGPDAPACPVISSASVPTAVKDSFVARYPSDSVITWFRKDSIGYSAYFIQASSQKTLAQFSNSGNFVKQYISLGEHAEFEDSTTTGTKVATVSCECEIPEGEGDK